MLRYLCRGSFVSGFKSLCYLHLIFTLLLLDAFSQTQIRSFYSNSGSGVQFHIIEHFTVTLTSISLSHHHTLKSHQHPFHCTINIHFTVTSSYTSLSHHHTLHCHIIIHFTVTSTYTSLSHQHTLHCHTFIHFTVTSSYTSFNMCAAWCLTSIRHTDAASCFACLCVTLRWPTSE